MTYWTYSKKTKKDESRKSSSCCDWDYQKLLMCTEPAAKSRRFDKGSGGCQSTRWNHTFRLFNCQSMFTTIIILRTYNYLSSIWAKKEKMFELLCKLYWNATETTSNAVVLLYRRFECDSRHYVEKSSTHQSLCKNPYLGLFGPLLNE